MARDFVYLDWAATSAIRPPEVIRAVTHYLEHVGASPGRGGHRLAIEADRVALACRQALAQLLGIPGDTGRIAFMFNATHAINTALSGILERGDVLVVTAFDHNAVLRCAWKLEREHGVRVRMVAGTPDGRLNEAALERALVGARLLSINGASNVLGTALDVRRLAAQARSAGALTLVDTAQVAGELPFDAASANVDLIAITGHKALLGPQGVGALWVREGIDVRPMLVGGTGGNSMLQEMPPPYPDHLQAGTLNAPGIAGLAAGARWVIERGVERICADAAALKRRLWEGLAAAPGVRMVSPVDAAAPIVTLSCDADVGALAGNLDREHGVLVRAGLHCAPETHRLLGTDRTGALRFSVGWATTTEEVDRAIGAMHRLLERRVYATAAGAAVRTAP